MSKIQKLPNYEHQHEAGDYNVEPDLEHIRDASTEAVLASMQLVRQYQLGIQAVGGVVLKPADKSLLTQVDIKSENLARQVLQQKIPEVPVLGEELGGETGNSERFLLVDPIDGTKPFVVGSSTSTVIVGSYNRRTRNTETVTIGQPATGLVWQAHGKEATKQLFDMQNGRPLSDRAEDCHVWKGDLHPKSIVFVDASRGYVKDGRTVMNNQQVSKLHQILQPLVDTQNYGSNGMHQALVASGGEFVAGSITTAIGGPWDVLGAKLVINAGGAAQGLRVESDGSLTDQDPLDPTSYDILITANNPETLSTLQETVSQAMVT